MIIKRLELTRVRAFEQAAFDFNRGMNLLVGVNGVGKSTVLDALRICLSRVLPNLTSSASRPLSFENEDITVTRPSLTALLALEVRGREFQYVRHHRREEIVVSKPGEIDARERAILDQLPRLRKLRKRLREIEETREAPSFDTYTPEVGVLRAAVKESREQPIGIYFSTSRSLLSGAAPSSRKAVGGRAAAYAEALNSRELRIAEMAYWMRAQQNLASEYPHASKHLAALENAAKTFLPGCKNLHAETSPKPRLLIRKGRIILDVRQLSDGERGLLALVLDLARRLSQANPELPDPVKRGEALVLIDELDLHLHPKWQRTIVERLTRVFPRCQFVATTHSPQIVAAVEPEQVLMFTAAGVVRPERTLGMDSNWILRQLMEADDRPASAAKAIQAVETLIKKGLFKKARAVINDGQRVGLDLPEWSVLEARMARLELLSK